MSSPSAAGQPESLQLDWTDLLLAGSGLVPQYILETSEDFWECRCGNTHSSEGFAPCDELGEIVPAELGPWDGVLNVCVRCWRIVNGNTLEVLRRTRAEVIEKNLDAC